VCGGRKKITIRALREEGKEGNSGITKRFKKEEEERRLALPVSGNWRKEKGKGPPVEEKKRRLSSAAFSGGGRRKKLSKRSGASEEG